MDIHSINYYENLLNIHLINNDSKSFIEALHEYLSHRYDNHKELDEVVRTIAAKYKIKTKNKSKILGFKDILPELSNVMKVGDIMEILEVACIQVKKVNLKDYEEEFD